MVVLRYPGLAGDFDRLAMEMPTPPKRSYSAWVASCALREANDGNILDGNGAPRAGCAGRCTERNRRSDLGLLHQKAQRIDPPARLPTVHDHQRRIHPRT